MVTPVYSLSTREPIKVIGDILVAEMGFIGAGDNCQVMLENERFPIPDNNQIYVALSYVGPGQVIASSSFAIPTDAGMTEVQEVTMFYLVQIDFMSYNPEARMRMAEFPMAIGSMFAQEAMAKNNVQIARQPGPFMDNSDLEETKRLNRYTTTIGITAKMSKTKAAAYYDSFTVQDQNDDGFKSPILKPEAPFNVH